MFAGDHISKLDDKGRLVFPAQLKALADIEQTGRLRFVVRKNQFRNCLDMFLDKEWQKQSEGVRARLDIEFNEEHDEFWSAYTSNRDIVVPDEKMGRILISKELIEMIDVRKEVVFAGKDFKIELWAKEHFLESKKSGKEYIALAKKILG